MGQQGDSLCLEVNHKEEVAWAQLGHLRQWLPHTLSCQLTVPPAINSSRVLDTIRLLGNCFTSLESLQVIVSGAQWPVGQPIFAGAAELLGLRSFSIEGGMLQPHDLHLHVLTGLKQLSCLRLLGCQGDGIGDAALMSGGLPLLTNLTCLEFRGSTEELSDEGIMLLSSLVKLQHLSIQPLGLAVTQEGLAMATATMRHLTKLQLGFSCSQQADIMQVLPEHVRDVEVVVADEGAEPPNLLTTCTLCVGSALTSLRLNTIKVEDASFLLALGALNSLTQLSLAAAPARKSTPGFMLNLVVLTQLRKLQSLEVAVVGRRLLLPLTTKQVPHLTAAWPQLKHLALSCMVPPQRMPAAGEVSPRISSNGHAARWNSEPSAGRSLSQQSNRSDSTRSLLSQQPSLSLSSSGQWRGPLHPSALTLLNGFTALQRLALIEPLPDNNSDAGACLIDDSDDEEWPDTFSPLDVSVQVDKPATTPAAGQSQLRRIPVALGTLPNSLVELVLERAELVQAAATTTAHTSDACPAALASSDTCPAAAAGAADADRPSDAAAQHGNKTQACEETQARNGDKTAVTGGPAAGQPPILPHLQSLALSYCKADDIQMQQLFSTMQQLTRLELNEVHGITGNTLQELPSLPHLKHLEVTDSRSRNCSKVSPTHPYHSHAPFATPHSQGPSHAHSAELSERSSAASASSITSWWAWLMGASSDAPVSTVSGDAAVTVSVNHQGNKTNGGNNKPIKPRLSASDIQHLAPLSSLRHLQWGVGAPLRVPSGLRQYEPDSKPASNSNGTLADKDPAMALGQKAYAAVQAMRAVVHTLASEASQLKDLHELYISALPDDPDVDQDRLMALLALADSSLLPAESDTPNSTMHNTKGRHSDTKQPGGGAKLISEAMSGKVNGRVPAWLAAAACPGCFVSGSLPTSEYDPWSNTNYAKAL